MNVTIVPYKLPDSVPTPKSECGWIAIYEGEAIGWNSLIFESHDTIKFANAYVKEEYRGQGIASELVETAKSLAAEKKFYKIVLTCSEALLPFYKRLGFEWQEQGQAYCMRLDFNYIKDKK